MKTGPPGRQEGRMDNIQKRKSARFIALVVLAMAILELQHPLSGILQGRTIAHIVTIASAFAMIPVLVKIWRVDGEKPFTVRTWLTWLVFLVLLVVGLIVIDAHRIF